MDKNSKKIEVISGDGKDLNISEVSTHLSTIKPKIKNDDKKQEIVIPQVKKKNDDKK